MDSLTLRKLIQKAQDTKKKSKATKATSTKKESKKSPVKKEETKTTFRAKKVCFYVREDLWTYVQNLAYTERKQITDVVEDILIEYQKNHSDKELIERPKGFRQR